MQKKIKRFLAKTDALLYRLVIGRPVSLLPYQKKREEILAYANEFEIKVLVETGTYLGETMESLHGDFQKLFTVELDKVLHERAVENLKKYPNVVALQGDSGTVLRSILKNIDKPTIFWLDAHYSGGETAKGEVETPIEKELDIIAKHHIKEHIILIDDARCFNGERDYPTLTALAKKSETLFENPYFSVKDDIIRIIPHRKSHGAFRSKKTSDYKEPFRLRAGQVYRKFKPWVKKIIRYKQWKQKTK